jgi:GntR family transcriptional regulator
MLHLPDATDRRLPLYQRLKDAFAGRIAQGEWRPGAAIPPEGELAAEYGVALGTVRKAIEGLVQEGLIDRRQGRGTFVRKADFTNALFRFFRHTHDGQPMRPSSRLLARRTGKAGARAGRGLGLAADARVLWLTRLRLVAGEPLVVDDIALPLPAFAALADVPAADFGGLLYPLYERAAGQVVARAREHIGFDRADAATAKRLGIGEGEPVVAIERIAFGYDGAALEWRLSHGAAERFSYDIEIR